jgi:hypothetical protein
VPTGENTLTILQQELRPRERLVWAGISDAKRHARQALPQFLIAIPFTAFAVFWTSMAVMIPMQARAAAPFPIAFIFPLFGLIFVGAGLAMLLSPLWKIWQGRSIVYGLTNERAIILTRWPSRRVQSVEYREMSQIERVEYGHGGRGDLLFLREIGYGWSRGWGAVPFSSRRGFLGISDARRVEAELSRLRSEALEGRL